MPDDLDVMRAIEESLAMSWSTWHVKIEVEASADEVRMELPRRLAVVKDLGEGASLLSATTNTLDWFAWRIAALPFRMTVISPPELRKAFRECARHLTAIADRTPGSRDSASFASPGARAG